MKRIGILGAGTWGMALARMLTVSGNDVLVWSAIEKEIDSLSTPGHGGHPDGAGPFLCGWGTAGPGLQYFQYGVFLLPGGLPFHLQAPGRNKNRHGPHQKDNAKFADGTPVTAEAVKLSFERLLKIGQAGM